MLGTCVNQLVNDGAFLVIPGVMFGQWRMWGHRWVGDEEKALLSRIPSADGALDFYRTVPP